MGDVAFGCGAKFLSRFKGAPEGDPGLMASCYGLGKVFLRSCFRARIGLTYSSSIAAL